MNEDLSAGNPTLVLKQITPHGAHVDREPPTTSAPVKVKRRRERLVDLPPWALLVQVFFGLGWLRAAVAKAFDPGWWSGETVTAFLTEHEAATLDWLRPLLDNFVVNVAPAVAITVAALQLLVGLSYVSNRGVALGLTLGMIMNGAFVAIGSVNPSAFYLIGQGALALWLIGRRPPSRANAAVLRLATGAAVGLALINLPFIATVHPEQVIADPAVMMVLIGLLTAAGLELTHRATFGSADTTH